MMNKIFRKKLTRGGFTLAELLIVVAIIAVLVAIAVPIFTGALEKARLGVHRSNARSLKSQGVALILGDETFENKANGSQVWVVVAKYDFGTEKFSGYTVNNITTEDAGAKINKSDTGKLFICEKDSGITYSTGVLGASDPYSEDAWCKFGLSDEFIGKIKTNGTCYYAAVITEQDLKDAKVTL